MVGAASDGYPPATSFRRISPMRVALRGITRQMRSATALRSSRRATESRHGASASRRAVICRRRFRSGAYRRSTLQAAIPDSRPIETVRATTLINTSGATSVVHPENAADRDHAGDLEAERDEHQAEADRVGD